MLTELCHVAWSDEDVIRLEVAVDNLLRVEVGEALRNPYRPLEPHLPAGVRPAGRLCHYLLRSTYTPLMDPTEGVD